MFYLIEKRAGSRSGRAPIRVFHAAVEMEQKCSKTGQGGVCAGYRKVHGGYILRGMPDLGGRAAHLSGTELVVLSTCETSRNCCSVCFTKTGLN